jgi:hypothetical protein
VLLLRVLSCGYEECISETVNLASVSERELP